MKWISVASVSCVVVASTLPLGLAEASVDCLVKLTVREWDVCINLEGQFLTRYLLACTYSRRHAHETL